MLLLVSQFMVPTLANAQTVTRIGVIVLGYDLDALMPENPSVEQQIAAGQHQLAIIKSDEPSFDSNHEMVEYLNAIVAKLILTSHREPPYPINVHFSSVPKVNAFSYPGGQIVLEERMFDHADAEAQLVAVIAHETEHELNNDFLTMWADYKNTRVKSPLGLALKDSLRFETTADLEGARLMYEAGWDPQGMVDLYQRMRFAVGLLHPPTSERIKALEALLAKLPPRADLVKDSARFQELKRKY
jgi:predicted Zn-dependent protease